MNLEKILFQIENFKIDVTTEEFEISNFFDDISDQLDDNDAVAIEQKAALIQALFTFLKNQNPETDENFSFIHLIESIDSPSYEIYEIALVESNKNNPSATSIFLLNRYINSLEDRKYTEFREVLKSITQNTESSQVIRDLAQDFYKG